MFNFKILVIFLNEQTRENQRILCMLMPPLLILMLVHMWYEESTYSNTL